MQPGETLTEWLISQLCPFGSFVFSQRSGKAIPFNKILVRTPTSGWSACASRRCPYDGRSRHMKLCLNKAPFKKTPCRALDAKHSPVLDLLVPCGARRLGFNDNTERMVPTLSGLQPLPLTWAQTHNHRWVQSGCESRRTNTREWVLATCNLSNMPHDQLQANEVNWDLSSKFDFLSRQCFVRRTQEMCWWRDRYTLNMSRKNMPTGETCLLHCVTHKLFHDSFNLVIHNK